MLTATRLKKLKAPGGETNLPTGASRVRGSGAQIVYESLRNLIVEMVLQPGSTLDEVRLAAQFSMSRTPIREAMVRLLAEGLVTMLPNRDTVVSVIDFVRLPVYFEALTLMYRVTARSAAVQHKPDHLRTIKAHEAAFIDAVERRDALAMIGSNRDFHMAIAEAGGNVYFNSLFTRLLDEGRRILWLYYSPFDDRLPYEYVLEHDAIVAAIEAGDPDLCERLAGEHAGQIVRQIQSYIACETASGIMRK